MSNDAARRLIEKALDELDDLESTHSRDHVEMYLRDALIWMRDEPKHEARRPHPLTMAGRK